ncbi:MAG: hypothetical protein IH820_14565 [Bacteroidetes bacterium]|nr:hypothetical protein [Bacteroidota bacterium]
MSIGGADDPDAFVAHEVKGRPSGLDRSTPSVVCENEVVQEEEMAGRIYGDVHAFAFPERAPGYHTNVILPAPTSEMLLIRNAAGNFSVQGDMYSILAYVPPLYRGIAAE